MEYRERKEVTPEAAVILWQASRLDLSEAMCIRDRRQIRPATHSDFLLSGMGKLLRTSLSRFVGHPIYGPFPSADVRFYRQIILCKENGNPQRKAGSGLDVYKRQLHFSIFIVAFKQRRINKLSRAGNITKDDVPDT